MTDYLELGHNSEPLRLHTVRGSAMPPTTMYALDGQDWDVTSALLVFDDGVTLAGVVDGPEITWTATQAQVDAHPNGSRLRMILDGVVCANGQVIQRG